MLHRSPLICLQVRSMEPDYRRARAELEVVVDGVVAVAEDRAAAVGVERALRAVLNFRPIEQNDGLRALRKDAVAVAGHIAVGDADRRKARAGGGCGPNTI